MFFRLSFTFVLSLLFSLGLTSNASAITVFSPVVELEVAPGETQAGVVKVYNETLDTIFLEASIEGVTAGEKFGQPLYLPPEEAGSHLNWFSLSQTELTLNSQQVAIVPFEVIVPSNTVPGGYYAVIFWAAGASNEQDSQVVVGSRVGTLIFIKVTGDLVEAGSIENFQVNPQSVLYQFPASFAFDFVNSGNIHLIPEGTITVKNFLGKEKILAINESRRFILPNSSRLLETFWGNSAGKGIFTNFFKQLEFELSNLTIGKHTAILDITYGSNKNAISQEIEFWVWPVRSLSLAVVVLVLLLLFIYINSKISKWKKALISNERQEKQQ